MAVKIVFMVKSESKQKRSMAVMHMAMMSTTPAWTQSNSKPPNIRIQFDIQFVFLLVILRRFNSSEIPDSFHPYIQKEVIELL